MDMDMNEDFMCGLSKINEMKLCKNFKVRSRIFMKLCLIRDVTLHCIKKKKSDLIV